MFYNCGPIIFNSWNIKGYDFYYATNKVNYKKALNANNKDYIFNRLNEISVNLKNLTFDNGEVVINSLKKTGFIGFLVCIESFKKMYEHCVKITMLFWNTFRPIKSVKIILKLYLVVFDLMEVIKEIQLCVSFKIYSKNYCYNQN